MDTQSLDNRTQLVKALQALQKARQRIDILEAAKNEPIAVVGMACRFPGADTPEALWQLLREGRDMVTEVPAARWGSGNFYSSSPGTIDKSYVRHGAFLEQPIDEFDAAFFGISPREANYLDPQQRLLLEVSWEALERAGLAPASLRGTRTGVFVGASQSEYLALLPESERTGTYATTGNAGIFASGRLSYVLGLQGPNFVVDTACSASLISVHLACESLRNGGSDVALACGVHLMLSPQGHIVQSQLLALAGDGRCRTFDAAANGYGRGEGCGVVVLKRLSDAIADGDYIQALIRGSATNHDGPSSGLTVPSAGAQAALVREALANAKVDGDRISYIEAHGTATKLGDPIEIRALSEVFGRRATPLLVGSIKTNFGHLEESAGIAGLLKVILSMQNGAIPAHLHFRNPTPHIDWANVDIRVSSSPTEWPRPLDGRRLAGVSSFGMGGSNAHAVIEEAPDEVVPNNPPERNWHLLTLSAKTQPALRSMASRYSDFLDRHPSVVLADLCYTTHTGRDHFAHRLSIVGNSIGAIQSGLQEHLVAPAANDRSNVDISPKIGFLFTGQGSQYAQMGRELYDTQPLFRERIEQCDRAFQDCLGRPLLELLYPTELPPHHNLLQSQICGQGATFAIECALADVWCSWGLEPDVVLGHGSGEFAAAYAAGVLSLEEGLRLVIEHGRLMEAALDNKMPAPAAETLDPVLAGFETALRQVKWKTPKCAVVSSITGKLVSGGELTDAAYWHKFLHGAMRFADGVRLLAARGCAMLLEIGPKATLVDVVGELLGPRANRPIAMPSLREGQSDWLQMLTAVGKFYTLGGNFIWRGLEQGYQRRKVQLPTYPFQRERYWAAAAVKADTKRPTVPSHPGPSTDDHLYRVSWRPQPKCSLLNVEDSIQNDGSRQWLIFGDDRGVGESLATLLTEKGYRPHIVFARDTYLKLGSQKWQINSEKPADYTRLFTELTGGWNIVHLWGADASVRDALEAGQRVCRTLHHLMQALVQRAVSAHGLWLVTRGAQAVLETDAVNGFGQGALWGLGKVLASEHPEVRQVCVDLDELDGFESQAVALAAELQLSDGRELEQQVAVRSGNRYVARLERYKRGVSMRRPVTVKADATYLVTGGLRGLGLIVARWLVERGARHLVLIGRSNPTPAALAEIAAMSANGANINVAKGNVSDRDRLAKILAEIDCRRPLAGIVHCANVTRKAEIFETQTWDTFREVALPKMAGGWHLHALTENIPLDFFICFSSLATIFGDRGLGAYVAANAYLDALAHHRRANGLACQSINWGMWSEAGAIADVDKTHLRLAQQGHGFVTTTEGLSVLEQLFQEDAAQVCFAPVDWAKFSSSDTARAPFFADLIANPSSSEYLSDRPAAGAKAVEKKVSHSGSTDDRVGRELAAIIGGVLRLPEDRLLNSNENLLALGLDSLMAFEVRDQIRSTWGVEIPVTTFLKGTSVAGIAAELLAKLEAEMKLSTNLKGLDEYSALISIPQNGGPEWINGQI